MRTRTLLGSCLCALVAGCLENDEEIIVRPDGRVAVEVTAHGAPADLADGYPLPVGGPWRAANDVTRAWIARGGPAPGEEEPAGAERKDEKVTLRATAEFDSADQLPRFFAPDSDPYRTAYLQRSARLDVERQGARTVYVFERTFHRRAYRLWDPMRAIDERMPKEIRERFERNEPLTAEQWHWVTDALRGGHQRVAESFVREAFLGLFVAGDAAVRTSSLDRAVERCRDAIGKVVTEPRLMQIYDVLRRDEAAGTKTEPEPLQALEADIRRAGREALRLALAGESLPPRQHNLVLGRYEWCIAASDHTADLGDEKFKVTVRMPGVVIAGNFDERPEPGVARFEFEGADLRDRDVVLRVVSVVE